MVCVCGSTVVFKFIRVIEVLNSSVHTDKGLALGVTVEKTCDRFGPVPIPNSFGCGVDTMWTQDHEIVFRTR